MASACSRIAQRTSISSIRSSIKSNIRASSSFSKPASSSSPLRQSLLTRFPFFHLTTFDFGGAEMRAVDVAAAQRGGGGENDVAPERDFQKLPSAFSGYSLLHLSRPLILSFSKIIRKLHIVNWEFAGPANLWPTASLSKLGLSVPR
ncbi:hypothetical protein GmHk_17G048753 [Glycine max]|nr:hypothetical protein GmHk_17G048753 [Glycine max]